MISINVNEDNLHFSSVDGVLYNKEKTKLLLCPEAKKSVSIPNTVKEIDEYAFDGCKNIKNIQLPNSVTSIGNSAFHNCRSLTSITIPNSVTSIGDGAFYNCTSLTSITIPNSVTSIGSVTFESCISLTSIAIPNSVISIGEYAFHNCGSLTYITIPNSVVSIGNEAFDHCWSLTSITIPNSVTSIGNSAFHNCRSLTSITIPNSVTSIGFGAFSYCTSLTDITIPDSVTSIGNSAFHNCRSLTSITIPNNVTNIGHTIFYECTSLTDITIPKSVTSIGKWAFYNCTSLTNITIPNSVTSIDSRAFENCENLILSVYKGSYGEKYAKENNLKYKVIGQTILPTSVKLNVTSRTIQKGKTYTLVPTITPSDATNKEVIYTTSNSKIATVTSNGTVKAINYGTADITVKTSNGKTATCKVTVPYTIKYNLNGGTNNKSNPTSYYGKKITLKNPTRKGYVFAGWYSDSKYKTKITSFTSGNKVLYAKWNKVSVSKAKTPTLTNIATRKMKVSYGATSGVKGYQIQYATNSKFTGSKTKITTARSYTITSLTKGKRYYVRVRGYKTDSTGNRVYGSRSIVKNIKISK